MKPGVFPARRKVFRATVLHVIYGIQGTFVIGDYIIGAEDQYHTHEIDLCKAMPGV